MEMRQDGPGARGRPAQGGEHNQGVKTTLTELSTADLSI